MHFKIDENLYCFFVFLENYKKSNKKNLSEDIIWDYLIKKSMIYL